MKPIECRVEISAPPALVWRTVADIERAAETIPAIKSIEILPGPRTGKGLRWRETRIMFGREATEVMEIAEWRPPLSHASGGTYVATAQSHGTAYRSEVRVEPFGSDARLTFTFEATALTLLARIMSALTLPLMKGMVIKALDADLAAIKMHCEHAAASEHDARAR
jgi:carbon monoxide dehydrogenase subunit G